MRCVVDDTMTKTTGGAVPLLPASYSGGVISISLIEMLWGRLGRCTCGLSRFAIGNWSHPRCGAEGRGKLIS